MADRVTVDRDDIFCERVTVQHPIDGGFDLFRQFYATISTVDEVGICGLSGWVGWRIAYEDLHDAADAISADAEPLGCVAQRIQIDREDRGQGPADNALFVDRMGLEPQYRGNRLAGVMIEAVADLFRFDAEDTIVVLTPEPQRPGGGPYSDGPERDDAMSRLCAAYAKSGLERWADTSIWWRPIR
ncbi:hypothetical protein [Phytoactinopolyspora limicola]|uniref:hypothetical protein n=1 Tax=Phytoactinopolyspora limicola TaxID=2715536 RepID=UPI00140CA0E9|nr:hypothetical protein [Phytoactinopolyspora limicola]